jgi:selenocysteine lyase/cysteine desulfurase
VSRRGFLGLVGGAASASLLTGVDASASQGAVMASSELSALPKAPAPDDEAAWEKVASQFLIRDGLIYMNTGTRGPSPRYVHERQVKSLVGINEDYLGYSRHVYNSEFQDALRAKLAAFVGAKPNEVALMNNTTDGMIAGTWGPMLVPGDEIAITNHDHSGGANPVLNRAKRDRLSVKVIDVTDMKLHPAPSPDAWVNQIEQALTPRTKLLSFCHINYTDGSVLPVKAICEMARSRGILTLVDGAQPPGMMKLDMHDLGCDMYAGPFHKWMMSAMHTGFFYVREDMLERVEAVLTSSPPGYNMHGAPQTQEYLDTAAKYERRGSSSTPDRIAMDAALDYHNHLTPAAIEARDRYLAQKLRDGLRAMGGGDIFSSEDPRLSCALVSFKRDGVETRDLNDKLWERHNIYIRNVTHTDTGWDANRASMHVMVTSSQVDTLLGAIEEISKA